MTATPVFITPASASPYAATKSNSKAKARKQGKKKDAPRNQSTIKRERQQTQQEITRTRRAIDDNTRRTRQNLDRLNNLDAQISRQQSTINSLNTRLDTINSHISSSEDSIKKIEHDVALLRADLKKSLRDARSRRNRINSLAFVFSSPDFKSATHRYAYLRQLQKALDGKMHRLRDKLALLDSRRASLLTLRNQHSSTLNQLNVAQQMMETQQGEARQLAQQLKAEGRNLQQVLAEKKRRAAELDRELNRIIEAEARAAAEAERRRAREQNRNNNRQTNSQGSGGVAEVDRSMSGPFSSNKGRLLFPVAGKYTITGTFGRSTRQGLAIDNSGIDISVSPGTKARAVFDGTVTSVFMMPTYHNVIIIRHGGYLTVYAGLTNISVSKGQKVKAGQSIGTIWTNPDADNRTELHFEVRHERTKLNPLEWVK